MLRSFALHVYTGDRVSYQPLPLKLDRRIAGIPSTFTAQSTMAHGRITMHYQLWSIRLFP